MMCDDVMMDVMDGWLLTAGDDAFFITRVGGKCVVEDTFRTRKFPLSCQEERAFRKEQRETRLFSTPETAFAEDRLQVLPEKWLEARDKLVYSSTSPDASISSGLTTLQKDL